MIDQFIAWFTAQANTDIFGGIAAVSLLGYAGYALRAVPAKLFYWAQRAFTTEVTVRNDDQMYFVLAEWLSKQPFMSRSRRLKLVTKGANRNTPRSAGDDDEDAQAQFMFVPAPGVHWFWYQRWPVLLEVSNSQEGKSETKGFMLIENIKLQTIGRSPAVFEGLMKEALAQIVAERRVRVTIHGEYGWNGVKAKLPRPLSSVITKNGLGGALLEDMAAFFDNRDWYVRRGIPWRRGYMLCGPPGTGKSSLVFALASELGVPIFVLSLGTAIDDGSLASLLMQVPERSVLLLEDVDTFSVAQARKFEKDGEKKELVSLSGLLNALDGVIAGEGRAVVMTTNHPERMDKALTRAGRIDRTETLGMFGRAECVQMWRLFFGDDPSESLFADRVGDSVQPAALQEHLMLYRDDARAAATHASAIGRAPLVEVA